MIALTRQNESIPKVKALAFLVMSFLLSLFIGLIAACDGQSETASNQTPSNHSAPRHPDKIWRLGAAILNDAALSAETLNAHLNQLLKAPSSETLKLTQNAWRKTASNIERFYTLSRLGIASTKEFSPLLEAQFNIAAWPIQPGYLDAYGEHIYSGIIFDIGSNIDEETLRNQHGFTDNADVTLGIYAIEYLLFGEKNQRSYLMFEEITALLDAKAEEGYESKQELPRNRRRELLRLQSKMLTKDLAQLRTLWSEKHPEGLSSRFQKHSKESRHILLTRITQNTITEQILAIAKQQKNARVQSYEVSIWQSRQLADRISAQLEGLAKLMGSSSAPTLQHLEAPLLECVETTIHAAHFVTPSGPQPNHPTPKKSPAKATQAKETSANTSWKDVYSCIREIARKLESTPENMP